MKIYSLESDFDRFDSCKIDFDACRLTRDIPEWEMMFNFDGSPQANTWWPRKMVRFNDVSTLGDRMLTIGSDAIVLKANAIKILRPIMGNIEILPLDCDFGDYWAINILSVLACIDYEKSQYELLSGEFENGRPRIMYFDKYAFKPETLKGYALFKIIDLPKSEIFVNEEFVETVKQEKITGFKFSLVWAD